MFCPWKRVECWAIFVIFSTRLKHTATETQTNMTQAQVKQKQSNLSCPTRVATLLSIFMISALQQACGTKHSHVWKECSFVEISFQSFSNNSSISRHQKSMQNGVRYRNFSLCTQFIKYVINNFSCLTSLLHHAKIFLQEKQYWH